MRRAHRETRRPTRGRPRGGVCGNRKVLFQGHSEHPRTGETLQPVPPESQASQSSPRESKESRETFQGQPRPLSTSPTHRRTSARGGRSPDEEGGSCPSFSPRPPSHGLLRHKREGTQPDGAPEAHQGMGGATTSSEAGTQETNLERSRSTSRLTRNSACTHQTGRVCNATGHIHRLWEHGQARHDQSETREGTTGRLTHPQGPREPLRKVRAGQRSGRRAAPLPSTHHRQTDGVERRGARWQNEKSGRHSP